MIDNATWQDWSEFAVCMLLFGMACGVCCYFVGRKHGYEAGVEAGVIQECERALRRAADAKRVGYLRGKIEGTRMTAQLMRPKETVSTATVIEKK